VSFTAHDLRLRTERFTPYDLIVSEFRGDVKTSTYFLSLTGGVLKGHTTGAPVAMQIQNRDWSIHSLPQVHNNRGLRKLIYQQKEPFVGKLENLGYLEL